MSTIIVDQNDYVNPQFVIFTFTSFVHTKGRFWGKITGSVKYQIRDLLPTMPDRLPRISSLNISLSDYTILSSFSSFYIYKSCPHFLGKNIAKFPPILLFTFLVTNNYVTHLRTRRCHMYIYCVMVKKSLLTFFLRILKCKIHQVFSTVCINCACTER